MKLPFVSCIMPTGNRQQFIPYAIDYFLHQDYRNSELIILDDGEAPSYSLVSDNCRIRYYYSQVPQVLGDKRNFCCNKARGDVIVHLDDDDWYAEDWIRRQVHELLTSGADVTGLNNVNFFLTEINKKWKYRDAAGQDPWAYGGTLAYLKSYWAAHPFKNLHAGEDKDFVTGAGIKLHNHNYTSGYLGLIHHENAGILPFQNPREKFQHQSTAKLP
jgi:glycosyltransferase involved in cell wall biosynthesis